MTKPVRPRAIIFLGIISDTIYNASNYKVKLGLKHNCGFGAICGRFCEQIIKLFFEEWSLYGPR